MDRDRTPEPSRLDLSGGGRGRTRDRLSAALRGFTLLELLVVVVILGVIAAVALPHLTGALERSKQRSTIVQIRELGQAYIRWRIDQEGAASAGREVFDPGGAQVLDPEKVRAVLEPTYLRHVKTTDSWGNPLRFAATGKAGARVLIASAGRDGEFELHYAQGPFAATDYDRDIVWSGSTFLQWPAGIASGEGG